MSNTSSNNKQNLKAVESFNDDSTVIYSKLSDLLIEKEFLTILDECIESRRDSQKKLYYVFYDFAISICLRYADDKDDALEILNDGFLKVFKGLKDFKPAIGNPIASFKAWLKKIMIFTAIDSYRKRSKYKMNVGIDDAMPIESTNESQLERISYKEIIECVQTLSPVYRTVFCLYVIDGFTHDEISKQLGIAIGTSKSNLAKARVQLQKKLLAKQNFLDYEQRAV